VVIESLKEKVSNIKNVFASENNAVEAMNIFLIPDIIKTLMKYAPKKFYDDDHKFITLITTLLLIPVVFRSDKDFYSSIYLVLHKLILPIAKQPEKYSKKVKQDLLSLTLFKRMVQDIDFEITVTSYN
jgi:uncharacterized protein (UPF0262 family)